MYLSLIFISHYCSTNYAFKQFVRFIYLVYFSYSERVIISSQNILHDLKESLYWSPRLSSRESLMDYFLTINSPRQTRTRRLVISGKPKRHLTVASPTTTTSRILRFPRKKKSTSAPFVVRSRVNRYERWMCGVRPSRWCTKDRRWRGGGGAFWGRCFVRWQ